MKDPRPQGDTLPITGGLGTIDLVAQSLAAGPIALAEEARTPSKTVRRAIFLSILIVAGFCVLTQYAGAAGFGLDRVAETWGSDPLGLSTLGKRYIGADFTWRIAGCFPRR